MLNIFRKPADKEDASAAAAALKDRGNAHLGRNEFEQATACYREAIRLKPDYADAYNNLGLACLAQGKRVEAEGFLVQALALNPALGRAHYNLGVIAQDAGRIDAAAERFRQATALTPGSAEILVRLGHCLHLLGRDAEAVAALESALAVDPACIDAYDNIGTILGLQGRLDEALACYRRALTVAERPQTHYSLGVVLQKLRRWDDAASHYRRAVELDPSYFQAEWNLALLRLLVGDYAEGFARYERCLVDAGVDSPRSKDAPHFLAMFGAERCWRGEPLAGRRLLLWSEQGLGDNLMMLRYLPLLRSAGIARLIVYCEAALARLVAQLALADKVLTKPEKLMSAQARPVPADAYDVHCSTMSLPHLLDTRADGIPAAIPYLRVPEDLRRRWAARLAALPGDQASLRVGLVWGGSKSLAGDALRSMALAQFAPLLALPGVSWVSLQKGEPAAQLRDADWPIADWMDECADLLDTAALVANLDLAVCVDTAVAHLAGALGRPVWLLNRYESEWRWGLEREDTPWYPSMRIFRQPALHDWESAIERIADELKVLAHGEGQCGRP